ncbi:DUF3883 domain-containing protein [Rhizobium ruizarguesonis]
MDDRTKVRVRKTDGELGSWTPPSIADDEFRQLIGSSVLEQFVAGHDPMDVVRELVQNEFDAGGAAMSLEFSEDALIVSGTGKFIDAKGWARLGVILGTGTVVGAGGSGSIAPKEDGIGSKNLGLRSLFRFGDRIHVYSNGKMAVLDLPCMGTLQKPDSASRAQAGIKIVVPFREQARGILSGFDAGAESHAIDEIAAGLFGTLGKLSLTGRKPGIRKLTVSSVRSGRRLTWSQTSKAANSPAKGISVTVRSGRLVDQTEGTPHDRITTYEEMEFSRLLEIPGSQVAPSYPPYYKARGGRVLVAVSVPLRRKRIDFTQEGYFHYPLRAPGGMTGTVLSASAPFELDADRSELVATDWNAWLAGEAGALVSDLLIADWIDRFGPDAFLALRKVGGATRSWFVDRIHFDLAAKTIWPTETSGKFAKASELVVPPLPELRGFLGKERDLKGEFASRADIADLARASGAKSFEANSLVRLRCAGNDRSALKTKMLPTDADFRYSDFNSALSQVNTQVSFAKALNAVSKRLSNNNRVDLKETVSTLAADGSLKPAAMLTVVDANIWAVCPIPLSTRLHPSLGGHRTITALCRRFDINAWVIDVAERARLGKAADEEREALYSYILASPETIGRSAVGAIRASPVIKNIAGTWKSPDELALLPSEMRRIFAAAVDAPSEEISSNEVVVKKLSIRRRLMPRDLVALAENVGNDVSAAQSCEEFLSRHSKLLTPKTVNELRQISFIRTKAGTVAAPEELHLNIAINTMTLDNDDVIVGGKNIGLYKLLKCRAQPSFKALMDMIKRHVRANTAPSQPEVLYSALFVAASLEKRSPMTFRDENLLWVNGAYNSPAETLVGQMVPRFMDVALPVVRYQGLLEKAYGDLGASRSPNENHWTAFFRWFDEKAETGSSFTTGELKNLRQAYARRAGTGLPEDVDDDGRCLLSRAKALYSPRDVRDQTLLEDDYPELAKAIAASESDLAFADLSDDGGQFFAAIGLKRLSEVCGIPHVSMGAPAQHPNWYTAAFERELLGLVHLPDFAIAIQALGWALERQGMGFRSHKLPEIARALRKIEKIVFVSEIFKSFDFNGVKISVRTAGGLGEDRIGVYPGRSQFEHHLSIAPVLAELVGAVRLVDNRMLAVSILPLLSCRTTEDVHGYLRSQGIQVRWSEPELELTEQVSSPPASAVEASETASKIINDLVGALHASLESPDNSASRTGSPSTPTATQFAAPPSQTRQLPPLDEVVVSVAMRAGTQIAPPGSGGWSGGSGSWTPPTQADVERDRSLGERGEALVLKLEVERLRALGHDSPESLVAWTSKTDAGADHDIRSIASDGKPLFIEVKSTTGIDGRFEWSRREFEKALREGEHYELWRVYNVGTRSPVAKPFPNPVDLLGRGLLRLELSTLRAFVEGKQ